MTKTAAKTPNAKTAGSSPKNHMHTGTNAAAYDGSQRHIAGQPNNQRPNRKTIKVTLGTKKAITPAGRHTAPAFEKPRKTDQLEETGNSSNARRYPTRRFTPFGWPARRQKHLWRHPSRTPKKQAKVPAPERHWSPQYYSCPVAANPYAKTFFPNSKPLGTDPTK